MLAYARVNQRSVVPCANACSCACVADATLTPASISRHSFFPAAQVVISSEHLANTQKQLKSRRLWGDGTYTDDSDLVAALVHQGYYHLSAIHPPAAVLELRVTLQLLPPQARHPVHCHAVLLPALHMAAHSSLQAFEARLKCTE